MKKTKQAKALVQTTVTVLIISAVIGGLASSPSWADSQPATSSSNPAATSQTNAVSAQTNSPDANPPVTQLTGAELYSMHCNRCHPERYPTERTAANWKTIMLHMQVRANLPASQSRLILKYLQDNSGR